jgi:hypothetical protein
VVQVGTTLYEGCSSPSESQVVSEGDDTDGDHVRNCKDLNDDKDLWCDGDYDHPYDPERGVMRAEGCMRHESGSDPCPLEEGLGCWKIGSPGDCPPEWQVCLGGGCIEFFVKVFNVSNPDPTKEVVFEEFQIFNQTLYLQSLPQQTVSESALALQGYAAGGPGAGGGAAQEEDLYRMEIWSRDPLERVAVVAEGYRPSDVSLGTIGRGTVLAVVPLVDGPGLFAEARYARGLEPWQSLGDADGDGRPDTVDNCLLVPNFRQTDADNDGLGNACDADFDGDGEVSEDDLHFLLECLGADLSLTMPIAEPEAVEMGGTGDGAQIPEPDPDAYWLAVRCTAADLDDDGLVDAADRDLAEAMLGKPPGPSVRRNLPPVADAGPDVVVECGAGTPYIDGSRSHDPDGFPVRCFWSSETCEFETREACSTWAICPPNFNHATLAVSDGTETTTDTTSLFFPACNSPGRVDEPILLGKQTFAGVGTVLEFRWQPSCLPGASDYGIYRGTLGDWDHPVALDCFDDGDPFVELVVPGAESQYYLVVPRNADVEGSYGHRSNGTERPRPADPGARCAAAQSLDVCPP